MATILNRQREPLRLPSGHILPAATGSYDDDFNLVIEAPGTLTVSNETIRGDNYNVLRGPIASGDIAVEFDDDEPVTINVPEDYLKPQRDAEAAAKEHGLTVEVPQDYLAPQKAAEEAAVSEGLTIYEPEDTMKLQSEEAPKEEAAAEDLPPAVDPKGTSPEPTENTPPDDETGSGAGTLQAEGERVSLDRFSDSEGSDLP